MSTQTQQRTYLPNSSECFVCGEDNHAGLQTRFYVEEDKVKMDLGAALHHCGYENTVHGGIVSAALDECMGWAAARAIHRMCVTAELTVRFKKRVPADHELTVVAGVEKAHRRMVNTIAHIEDETGEIYAQAEARFMPLSIKETLEVDRHLIYRDGDERVFEGLHEKE